MYDIHILYHTVLYFPQVDTRWQKDIALIVELYFHHSFFRKT